jgi:hypothetical protein
MRWNSRSGWLAAIQLAWVALVVAAFYRENGDYFLTRLSDFLRVFRSALV